MLKMKRITVNLEIYSDESIRKAIQAYCTLAKISIKQKKEQAIITFWHCKYDEDRTAKEFENYLIGIENS